MNLLRIVIIQCIVFFICESIQIVLNILGGEDECPTVTPGQNQEPEQKKDEKMKTLTT